MDIAKYSHKIIIQSKHNLPDNTCRDVTDIKYLECAIAANADYIISGDNDLLDMKEFQGIKIVNASDYLEIVNSI
jgi:predicted nucleic acid-binding protein